MVRSTVKIRFLVLWRKHPRRVAGTAYGLLRRTRLMPASPDVSPVSATASQVLPWLRYVSAHDPQRVKNTPAVANLTCLATKGLKTPRDETDETSGLGMTVESISTVIPGGFPSS